MYLEALRCDPNYSNAYTNLGFLLASTGRVTLLDGRTVGKKELYLEALRCDPNNSNAYYNLGFILASTERVTLFDGRTLGNKELYLEAQIGRAHV